MSKPPTEERIDTLEQIVHHLSEYHNETLGRVEYIAVGVSAGLDEDKRQMVELGLLDPDDIPIEEYDVSGDIAIVIEFANTDHQFRVFPYVNPSAPAKPTADWVIGMIQEAGLPPDLA